MTSISRPIYTHSSDTGDMTGAGSSFHAIAILETKLIRQEDSRSDKTLARHKRSGKNSQTALPPTIITPGVPSITFMVPK